MALTENFKRASKRPGKRPVLLVRIQDPEGETFSESTQADWEAATANVNMSTSANPGHIIPEIINDDLSFTGGTGGTSSVPPFYDYRGLSFVTPAVATFPYYVKNLRINVPDMGDDDFSMGVIFSLRSGSWNGTVVATTIVKALQFYVCGSAPRVHCAAVPLCQFNLLPGNELSPNTTYYLSWSRPSGGIVSRFTSTAGQIVLTPKEATNAYLLTQTIDLRSIPINSPTFSFLDQVESGANVAYEIFADNAAPPTTSRGEFSDGNDVPPYRYYRIKIKFTSTNGARGNVDGVSLTVGSDLYLGTTQGFPNKRTVPVMFNKSTLALSSKIDLLKGPSIGEISIDLLYTKEISELIKTGYMKNKSVRLLMGTEDISLEDFITVFGGTWFDYKVNHITKSVSITLRTILEQLKKTKLPIEVFNSAGVRNTTDLVFTNRNIVDAMLDILEDIGISDRHIDVDTATAIRDLYYTGATWNVTRTINKDAPETGFTLLVELSIISGLFLVQMPSGVCTFVRYDATTAPSLVLDSRYYEEGVIVGQEKELLTRQLVFYGQKSSTQVSNSEKDYNYLRMEINATAEVLWGEYKENRFFDKWNSHADVRDAMIARFDSWFATPRLELPISGLPIHLLEDTLPGSVIGIKNTHVPQIHVPYPLPVEIVRSMLVLDQKVHPLEAKLDVVLMEMDQGDPPTINITTTSAVPISVYDIIIEWETTGDVTHLYYSIDGADYIEIELSSVPQTSLTIPFLESGPHYIIMCAMNGGGADSSSWYFETVGTGSFTNGFDSGFAIGV